MKIGSINLEEKIFIIAEIGNNHEGSIDVAHRMVEEVAKIGADAVKFQTFQTQHYIRNSNKERFERLKSFELSYGQFKELSNHAKDLGLLFISTPFDLESVEHLEPLVSAFKIASGDSTFYPLINKVAATGKPIILSSGATTLEELKRAEETVETRWNELKRSASLALLHCVSAYPVDDASANLKAIKTLQSHFPAKTIGYSDHTLGSTAPIMAASLGARIIEKHFTLDKNYSDFRDHQLSANPDEFKKLVNEVRRVESLLGDGEKRVMDCEAEMRIVARRSIVAHHDLAAGHTLTRQDFSWTRPADSAYLPGDEEKILGKKLSSDLAAGDPFSEETF